MAAIETSDGAGRVLHADPCVIVWNSETLEQRTRIFHGQGMRAVQALAFSPDGTRLVTVCTDNPHTMFVWDWSSGQCLLQRRTRPGAPPCVYGVMWSPFEPQRLATYGENHVMFWTLRQDPGKQVRALVPRYWRLLKGIRRVYMQRYSSVGQG